ncbi:MAG: NFACT family protein [archaeon]|jgi:predicted ribosome quality control (RQC) complex YloA/Tae2 family protein
MDIQLSNLALLHLVEELKFFENGFVNNVQTLENGWLKFKIHTKELGDKQLVVTPNALFVSNYSLSAKQNPGGFSALLKKHLNNQRIVSLSQHLADRIIVMTFPKAVLILELFAKGNIVLCDNEMKIIKAMRREEWKDRKLEQNAEYKFPSSRGINPAEATLKDFTTQLSQNSKTFFGACVDIYNTSPLILEFAFDELKLDKKKDAQKATPQEVKSLFEKMKSIYSSKESKVFLNQNVIYSTEIGKEKEREFESITAALNILLLSEGDKKEIKIKEISPVENPKTQKAQKDTQNMLNKIKGFEISASENQKKGEEIFTHYQQIDEVLKVIQKGKQKGLEEKEILEKINSIKPIIKELDFKKKRLVLILN